MSAAYKLALIAAIVAYVEARFGQEQVPVADIQALEGQFGQSGQAATLAGQVPSVLLAGASPCEKLSLADEIVATLGNDATVISAAAGLVGAEQNFNPFAVSIPNICGDSSLPATEALRGIVPVIDPDVVGSDIQNANAAQSLQTPFDATGLSVADIMIANGFNNFNIEGTPAPGADPDGGAGGDDDDAGDDVGDDVDDVEDDVDDGADNGNGGNVECGAGGNNGGNDAGNDAGNDDAGNDDAGDDAGNDDAGNDDAGDDAGDDGNNNNVGGVDFGLCDPTIDLQGGRAGRPADELTFLPVDPLVAEGQQEALNPNIITNRVCDQLINVCEANDAAVSLCEDAQAQVEASGDRTQAAADLFNSVLGF